MTSEKGLLWPGIRDATEADRRNRRGKRKRPFNPRGGGAKKGLAVLFVERARGRLVKNRTQVASFLHRGRGRKSMASFSRKLSAGRRELFRCWPGKRGERGVGQGGLKPPLRSCSGFNPPKEMT